MTVDFIYLFLDSVFFFFLIIWCFPTPYFHISHFFHSCGYWKIFFFLFFPFFELQFCPNLLPYQNYSFTHLSDICKYPFNLTNTILLTLFYSFFSTFLSFFISHFMCSFAFLYFSVFNFTFTYIFEFSSNYFFDFLFVSFLSLINFVFLSFHFLLNFIFWYLLSIFSVFKHFSPFFSFLFFFIFIHSLSLLSVHFKSVLLFYFLSDMHPFCHLISHLKSLHFLILYTHICLFLFEYLQHCPNISTPKI